LTWLSIIFREAERQREAVAYFQSHGAFVEYAARSNSVIAESRAPKWLIELVGVDNFQEVDHISFLPSKGVQTYLIRDDDLALLKDLPNLRTLKLFSPHLTDAALRHIRHLKTLERLEIWGSLRGNGLTQLASLPALEEIQFVNVRWASGKPTSTILPFSDPDGFEALKDLPRLRSLWIPVSGDRDLQVICGIEKLDELGLGFVGSDIAGGPLTEMEARRSLKRLHLFGDVTGNHLSRLNGFSNLRELLLSGAPLTGDDLRKLPKLPMLETLDLSECHLKGGDMRFLPSLPELQTLDVSETEIGDESLIALSRFRELRHVDLSYTKVTSSAVASLRKDRPEVEVWD
jgi:hypothetical protein